MFDSNYNFSLQEYNFERTVLIQARNTYNVAIIASRVSKNQSFRNYATAHIILWLIFLIILGMAMIGHSRR